MLFVAQAQCGNDLGGQGGGGAAERGAVKVLSRLVV